MTCQNCFDGSKEGRLQGSEAYYLQERKHSCYYKRARKGMTDNSGPTECIDSLKRLIY